MAKKSPKRKAPSRSQSTSSGSSYPVGYGRPPLHGQFKPGVSGNPRGRPKGRLNLGTVMRTELNRRITIREGDRSRIVSKGDAFVMKTINGALNDNPKAAAILINLLRALGLVGEPSDVAGDQANTDTMPEEQEIIDFFLKKHKDRGEKK
jgi:hypothetical protein